jgi:hypothetical protein
MTVLALIFILAIKDIFVNKIKWTRILTSHLGLLIGYVICFFAPGNFNRMLQSHDAAIVNKPLLVRLSDSVEVHYNAFFGPTQVSKIIAQSLLAVFVIILIMNFIKERQFLSVLKRAFGANIEYIVAILVSPLLWGVLSYTPVYGVMLWQDLVIILLFKQIHTLAFSLPDGQLARWGKILQTLATSLVIPCALVVIIMVTHYHFFKNLRHVTLERRALITAAVAQGLKDVTVPAYPKSTSNYLTRNNYSNSQAKFDSISSITYYGIHITIKQAAGK